jgi:hypothetical protein
VTFAGPFTLSDLDGVQPAGTYLIEADEEEIGGPSFIAYRRINTLIHLRTRGVTQVFPIDPIELEATLLRDVGATVPGAHTEGLGSPRTGEADTVGSPPGSRSDAG